MCMYTLSVSGRRKISIRYTILGFYNKWQNIQTPNISYMLAARNPDYRLRCRKFKLLSVIPALLETTQNMTQN